MESKKLVLFGAGKIGRSFVGQLFSRSGYEVVFVDIDDKIITELNRRKKYQVVIKREDGDEILWVENVRGLLAKENEEVVQEITSAGILAVSVGPNAISKICPLIARGIARRSEKYPGLPLDIILAENLRDASKVVRVELTKHLPVSIDLGKVVGLVETSIGKMVPIMPEKVTGRDPLLVHAEPYNTLILDKMGFKNPIPQVFGLAPKENMPAWVDRKSFIHNLGHAAAAYYGFLKYPDKVYLFEIMAKKDVSEIARSTMLQSAEALMRHYPGVFTKSDLITHIDDLLHRFSNRALGDTVYRVGQDRYRKLGPEDRLAGALKMALKYQMSYDKILYIIACSLNFKAVDEHGFRSDRDKRFDRDAERGISHVLETVCNIRKENHPEIHIEAQKMELKPVN